MLVTHEGPAATLSREQLIDVVCVWYRNNHHCIQLPDPVAVDARLCCTSVRTYYIEEIAHNINGGISPLGEYQFC